jgi:hypothetical protein
MACRRNSPRIRPLVLLLVLGCMLGCSRRAAPPADLFGAPEALSAEAELSADELAPYLAFARAVLAGQDRPASVGMKARAGRRVFLTAYHPGATPQTTTGLGTTLQESVRDAAQLARSTRRPLDEVRLQLDVVTSVAFDRFPEEIKPEPDEIGRYGYLLARDERHLGYVLPGEIITAELYDGGKRARLKRTLMAKRMASRARVEADDLKDMTGWRFETRSVVESTPPGRALPLMRGMVERRASLTADDLMTAARLGADYLVRVLDDRGRFIYAYQTLEDKPGKDEDGADYNMLRHCGTTYALLEAYEAFQDPRYLEAAERALKYLQTRLRRRPAWVPVKPGIGDFVHVIDEDRAELSKLGGAGLALIALSKHAALTGDGTHLGTMRGIARYILHQQEENGHFLSYFQYKPEQKVGQKDILYYPGEAMLGLMRLYALDPDRRWLEAARRGADYLIFTRDVKKSESNLDHDHWLSYALNELYRATKNQAYADHAFKISRAIMLKQKSRSDAPAPDFVGGFYKIPASTPASVRLEAYAADITLARYAGTPDASLIEAAMDVAGFVEAQQFDEQRAYFVANPARALGGVRESLVNNDVRIDYVQHALSGMLGFARALRDPAFGKVGEPGVLPVKRLKEAAVPELALEEVPAEGGVGGAASGPGATSAGAASGPGARSGGVRPPASSAAGAGSAGVPVVRDAPEADGEE